MIEQRHGKYTLDNIPIHDKCIYDLFSKGDVMGVFQVEGCLSGDSYIGHRTIKELYEDSTLKIIWIALAVIASEPCRATWMKANFIHRIVM